MGRRAWLIGIALLLLPPRPAVAGGPTPDRITLRDGSVVVGEIVERTADRLVLRSPSLGELVLDPAEVTGIEYGEGAIDRRAGRHLDPDVNTLMLTPTPETVGRGNGYFRNFELLFLNFGLGLTDDLDASLGFLFPISSSFQLLSAGVKYRLLSREEHPVGLALAAGGTIGDELRFGNLSAVAGVGDRRRSLNLSVHMGVDEDAEPGWFVIAGGDLQVADGGKLLAELGVFGSDRGDGSSFLDLDDADGFVNLGFRLFGEGASFSLSGLRPIGGGDWDDFIAIPMLMYSKHW